MNLQDDMQMQCRRATVVAPSLTVVEPHHAPGKHAFLV